jgi:rubredoxin
MKRWICIYCGFIYDESAGRPDEGIPAGTRWADVPGTWECPDCGNPKSAFVMEEI